MLFFQYCSEERSELVPEFILKQLRVAEWKSFDLLKCILLILIEVLFLSVLVSLCFQLVLPKDKDATIWFVSISFFALFTTSVVHVRSQFYKMHRKMLDSHAEYQRIEKARERLGLESWFDRRSGSIFTIRALETHIQTQLNEKAELVIEYGKNYNDEKMCVDKRAGACLSMLSGKKEFQTMHEEAMSLGLDIPRKWDVYFEKDVAV